MDAIAREIIKEKYGELSIHKLIDYLMDETGKIYDTHDITKAAKDLGLTKEKKHYPWSKQIDQFLKDNYLNMNDADLRKCVSSLVGIRCCHDMISQRLKKLGLSREKVLSETCGQTVSKAWTKHKPSKYEVGRWMVSK